MDVSPHPLAPIQNNYKPINLKMANNKIRPDNVGGQKEKRDGMATDVKTVVYIKQQHTSGKHLVVNLDALNIPTENAQFISDILLKMANVPKKKMEEFKKSVCETVDALAGNKKKDWDKMDAVRAGHVRIVDGVDGKITQIDVRGNTGHLWDETFKPMGAPRNRFHETLSKSGNKDFEFVKGGEKHRAHLRYIPRKGQPTPSKSKKRT